MLVGKVLRSPHAHARILRVDTSRAEQLPGVRAVVTSADSTGEKWGVFRYTQDQAFLPSDKVRFIGEEVAAVAAVDEDTALEALELINVEYEELPAVFTIDEAMKPGAVLIHETNPGNINVHVKIDVGDVEKGFAASYYVREDTFSAPEESYFQAEPYAVVAQFDNSGNLDIWMPNAGPHLKAKPLSNCLRMPLNKVRVRKITIGGAFGGRSEISPADVICALLARKSRQPVKLAYTREENTIATRQAHSMTVDHQDGRRPGGTGCYRGTSRATWTGAPTQARGLSPRACPSSAWSRPTAWRTSATTVTASSPTSRSGACSGPMAGRLPAASTSSST